MAAQLMKQKTESMKYHTSLLSHIIILSYNKPVSCRAILLHRKFLRRYYATLFENCKGGQMKKNEKKQQDFFIFPENTEK